MIYGLLKVLNRPINQSSFNLVIHYASHYTISLPVVIITSPATYFAQLADTTCIHYVRKTFCFPQNVA